MRAALAVLGPLARRSAGRNAWLRVALEQAHAVVLPESFVALAAFNTLLVLLVSGAAVIAIAWSASGAGRPPPPGAVATLATMPALLAGVTWVVHASWPKKVATARKRRIERSLPYAVNYVAAMAGAGVVPAAIVRDLARQPVYGEVAREFAWMARDMDLLGLDLVTAINRAIARSPSLRFQDFLQGTKTSLLSGGDLSAYFASKADQYMGENRRVQKEMLDGLAVLAESYVTVVIAGPLFMIVLLSIMAIVGKAAAMTEYFLFALAFALLPLCHGGFAWVIHSVTAEA